ncbi:MAG: hypothetical protein DRI44_08650 [Chlamydiae bacterium]|nr:MAG: hypothetical protein DRI44_08650 [Chlamydiota bacterium]
MNNKKIKSETILSANQLADKNSKKIPVANYNQKSEKNKPEVASKKIIDNKTHAFTKDTHNCSTEEKINMALEKLGLKKLSKEERAKPGIYSMDDVVNKIFDISRPVTSNDIADLAKLDQRQLVDLANGLLGYNLSRERYAILYEVCLRDCNSPYIRAEAAYQLAFLPSKYDQIDLYKMAIKLGRMNDQDKEMAHIECVASGALVGAYINSSRFKDAINLANQMIERADNNPNPDYKTAKGSAIDDKIRCLFCINKANEALQLFEQAKNMDVGEIWHKHFNSKEYKKAFIDDMIKP